MARRRRRDDATLNLFPPPSEGTAAECPPPEAILGPPRAACKCPGCGFLVAVEAEPHCLQCGAAIPRPTAP